MKCDRCYKNIPDTQIYDVQIGIPLTPVILCKKCIDEYKELLSEFRGYSTLKVGELDYYPTRERLGSIPHDIPYNIMSRLSKDIPHEPFYINQRARPEPKHEGRRPTNIFSKLFYMLFFEKIDP